MQPVSPWADDAASGDALIRRAFWFIVWAVLRAYAALFCRKITICAPDGTPYLDRWFLWDGPKGGAFLHRFHQSDPDRGWHCHPWFWCASRILRGSYDQVMPPIRREWAASAIASRWFPGERRTFSPGDLNRIEWHEFHAVSLRTSIVWTLFTHSHKHGRSWGFASEPGPIKMARPTDGQCPAPRRHGSGPLALAALGILACASTGAPPICDPAVHAAKMAACLAEVAQTCPPCTDEACPACEAEDACNRWDDERERICLDYYQGK